MRLALIGSLLLAFLVSGASAAQQKPDVSREQDDTPVVDTLDVSVFPAPYWSEDRGRKDAQEVLLPQPAQGPASPFPFCNPSAPVCP